jgi:transposase
MWQPYIDTVKAQAPQAVLVFDKFHIVRHLMEALDQVRRDEIREKGPEHKARMHKTRFLWLKNPWNLTERQAFRLSELERLNLKINRAYLLKERFRHFWDSYASRQTGLRSTRGYPPFVPTHRPTSGAEPNLPAMLGRRAL